MRVVVALLTLVLTLSPPAVRAAEPVDLLLVLAADVSRSVTEPKFKLQREGAAAAITHRLTGAPEIRLFYDFLLNKEAGAGNPTPWHQDRLYCPLAGDGADHICSTWIALAPVTLKSGAVEYIKGSHAWGKHFALASFNDDGRYGSLDIEAIPEVEGNRGDYDIVNFDLEPGDCVAHHVMTVHGAPENNADIRRRGLSIRWLPGKAPYDPREETQHQLMAAPGEAPDTCKAGKTSAGHDGSFSTSPPPPSPARRWLRCSCATHPLRRQKFPAAPKTRRRIIRPGRAA